MARMSVNADTAYALSNALSYWLTASAQSYGSGDHDPELEYDREQVEKFLDRLDSAFPA